MLWCCCGGSGEVASAEAAGVGKAEVKKAQSQPCKSASPHLTVHHDNLRRIDKEAARRVLPY
jgi:hypothetical protein